MSVCEICGQPENFDTMAFCEGCGADGCTDCVVDGRCEDCRDFDDDDVDQVLEETKLPWMREEGESDV